MGVVELTTVFYRYRKADLVTLQALCEDKLYFSPPKSFNDPFDSHPSLENDSGIEALREIYKKFLEKRSYTKKKIDAEFNDLEAHIYNSTEEYEYTEEEVKKKKEFQLKNSIEKELLLHYNKGVCCFAKSYSNPLLWSHYGDQHQGICIGYTENRQPKPKMREIRYINLRAIKASLVAKAILDEDEKALNQLDEEVLLRKAMAWEYEKEWRILGESGLQNSPLYMQEITFGMRCSNVFKYILISTLQCNHDLVFYEIVKDINTYDLHRRKIDDESMCQLMGHFGQPAQSSIELFPDD